MASTAISAQGSTLSIGTGATFTPVTIATATVTATPTGTTTAFTTGAAHGLVDGSRVTILLATGTGAALVNGIDYPVSVTSSTGFTIPVNTNGLTLTVTSATVTGTNYTGVSNLRTFSGLDGQASEIDVTNLSSAAKEIRLGLVDYGQIQLEADHDLTNAGQARLQAQYVAGSLTPFVLALPNGDTASFHAFVRKFSLQGGVDQVVRRQIDLRITGPVSWC